MKRNLRNVGPERDDPPEVTREQLRSGRSMEEAYQGFSSAVVVRRTRGPQKAPTKHPINIRVSPDVLNAYKATGKGWQGRMNEILAANAPRVRRKS